MYCLKCGKETQDEHVFCDHCLEIMEQYPVKPGTPAPIPLRKTAAAPKKASRHRIVTQDEQIRRLRVTVRVLAGCLLIVSLLLGFFLWQYFQKEEPVLPEKEIGQNYTVDSTDSD